MKTNAKTTYILLERGVEDVALLREFHKIFSNTANKPENLPMIMELMEGLKMEVREYD